MRRLSVALLGSILAGAAAALSFDRQFTMNPIYEPTRRATSTPATRWRVGQYPTPSRMQSHTGAGGQGAHRRWKKRRSAGIY